MNFSSYLNDSAAQIDRFLDKFLKEWVQEVGKTAASLLPLVEEFIKACWGGKRLRGTLVVLGYEMGKKSSVISRSPREAGQSPDIIKIAAAYEIFHAAILAHDDIIDQSLERRGRPSLYQALGGNHYGISQAITLADAGFFLAIQIISESKFAEKLKNQALRVFAKTMVDTATGQMLDIQKGDPTTIMRLKTAQYTITGPLQIGAILAGIGPTSPRLRRIKEFGESVGIAFQIKDDILDGESKEVEKDQAKALEYALKAKKIIPEITKDERMSKILDEMCKYLVERRK